MGLIIFSAKGIILSPDKKKVLLLKRAVQDRYRPEHWELPGGKVETWNFKKEFARETWEEAGISVGNIVWLGGWLKKSVFCSGPFGWPTLHLSLFLQAKSLWSKVVLSVEHTESRWFELEGARPSPLTPETEYALKKYLRR